MVFSSLIFLLIFLPMCICTYHFLPIVLWKKCDKRKLQNSILLVFSILFYAFGGVKYLALILCMIIINWLGGFLVEKNRSRSFFGKFYLVLIVALNLFVLFYFKYFNLSVSVFENVFHHEYTGGRVALTNIFLAKGNGMLGIPEIILPIGISFYTFQALSYVIDVYRGVVGIQKNLFSFALYISFFPQLIAGPIVHYKDIEEQIEGRRENSVLFSEGIKRFCFGLAKKVLIANTLGEIVDNIWAGNLESMSAIVAWFGAICYSFQIYYDFSGYSDMAIGLGKMFGFEFKENFNFPYRAESVQDFWRRWHISLSTWFRDYVYIPLGGSRCSNLKIFRNVFIVFLLTGIWHGPNWTFVTWGVVYGLLLILERAFLGNILKKNKLKFLNRLGTFIVVTLLWVVFRADDIFLAGKYIGRMFSVGKGSVSVLSFLSFKVVFSFVFAYLFSGVLQKIKIKKNAFTQIVSAVFSIALLIVSIILLVNGTYNPFIYFQF